MSAHEIIQPPKTVELAQAPSLVPDPAIDVKQLGRLAHDDPKMMRDLLQLFDLETDILLARIGAEEPRTAAARAHTLAVSARAVGAWKIAETATEFERRAMAPRPVALADAVRALACAATQAQMEIHSLIAAAGERTRAC
jgi:HPt (histidine-containing phosphotransfer) domain-containing protein